MKSRPLLRVRSIVVSHMHYYMHPRCGDVTAIPNQPDQSFGSNVLSSLQFVENKSLKGLRLGRGSLLPVLNFL